MESVALHAINTERNSTDDETVTGEYVSLDGERYYRIANSHQMPEFFMSLVGASDHWMFVSSHGALTAGRCDPDSALFPYAADDQISIARANTGCLTLVQDPETGAIWEPFHTGDLSESGIRRNLYKTPLGNKLVFEEVNEDLELVFRYRWVFSERFGFVRSCRIENTSASPKTLRVLDGIRNVLPYGVGSEFMMRFSNLGNAYKKNELVPDSGVGLFYLSSIPTDRAEPSEGLKATTVWQTGIVAENVLLSSAQVNSFRRGQSLTTESDVRGRAGAFLVEFKSQLGEGDSVDWHVVAELEQDHADIIGLNAWLQSDADIEGELEDDITAGEQDFLRIISSSDALQLGANARRTNRHLSNTVFNVMRGGIPLDDYVVQKDDFLRHLRGFNREVCSRNGAWLEALPESIDASELRGKAEATGDVDLSRLAREYLPLAFSRRHGDPTRPWNRFAIHLRAENGGTNLNYQGNWRDIFQNWEALGVSFPEFSTSMICRFVNATTADGYNPYRVTKGGFEWEEPTPEDPWANIGYWGDHQIIYLLKLLEWNRSFVPTELDTLLTQESFVHANVPYRIKGFECIKRDPQDTIDFDAELASLIEQRVSELGTDGKLVRNQQGELQHVTLLEKFLVLTLAKLSNFVPDGGIWLNTQRPEWNDANNALVGSGLSMVTTCYLYRWCCFLRDWIATQECETFSVSSEVSASLHQIFGTLVENLDTLEAKISPEKRAEIVEALSRAGAGYRDRLYGAGLSGEVTEVDRSQCVRLFDVASRHLESSIRSNRRDDGLYHSYNLLNWNDSGLEVEHLYEMLEGQVAVLSCGLLTASETCGLLDALRESSLYRANQNSYMLYPDRALPRFLEKNLLDPEFISASPLLQRLLQDGDESIVRRNVAGGVHFNGNFRNAADMRERLAALPQEYGALVEAETQSLAAAFEDQFGHRQFTGRSGTFFAYEGLGSIYWHMVSKLGLAVSEAFFQAVDSGEDVIVTERLKSHFQEIRRGIGCEKSPAEYGAFPSDPYSHTPENAGAKQPGMTGQVKEDILSRFAEVGAHFVDGRLCFRLELFDTDEQLSEPAEFQYYAVSGKRESVSVGKGGFGFTLCQVPFVCGAGGEDRIEVRFVDGQIETVEGTELTASLCKKLFARTGEIQSIHCRFVALS